MIFDRNDNKPVIALLGAGSMGTAIVRRIAASAAERTGTSDEIAEAGAFLLGEHAGFITGTDLLIDGGTIAAIRTGQYKLGR